MLIGYKKFLRSMLKLAEPSDVNKEQQQLIDGVGFQWNVKDKVWECTDTIGYKPAKFISVYCIKCKSKTDHVLNKDGNKIKCQKCQTITSINI